MLREKDYILRQINVVIDFSLAIAAFFVAHGLRVLARAVFPEFVKEAPWVHYAWVLFFLPFLTIIVLGFNGLYKSHRLRLRIRDLIRLVAVSVVEITVLLIVYNYITWRGDVLPFAGGSSKAAATKGNKNPKAEGFALIGDLESGADNLEKHQIDEDVTQLLSRALIMLIGFVLFCMLSVKTYWVRRFLIGLRRRGYNFRRVLLVGSGEPLRRFIDNLESHPIWGLKIEGIITDRAEAWDREKGNENPKAEGFALIGDLESGAERLEKYQIDEVVFVPYAVPLVKLVPLMEACELMGIRTHLPLHYFKGRIAKPSLDYFDEIPVISYLPTQQIGPAMVFKFAFDRIVGAILLVLFSPLFLITIVAIKLSSKNGEPVFFKQERSGLNGRMFTFWKFRTMKVGAEERQAELETLNEADGPVFKIKDDPRVTRVGRLLRKFSIDELPQLWNVVRGEMSLVGPRPPLPSEVKNYDRWQRRRLSMKPGITCLWQVEGRHRVSFDAWMKLDLQYIDNWSLMLDFKILMRTIFAVITGQGAM